MSYDSDVVSATGGVGEADWDKIIKLCNRIRDSVGPTSMHQAMQSVMKRVKHSNPAVQIHALTLLEACVSNCGLDFQKELITQFFQSDVKSILLGKHTDAKVAQRLKELLLSWSSEFKSAPHMKDFHKFLEQLRRDGVNFSTPAPTPAPSSSSPSPATQTTQAREEEDLKKAIQLSLQDRTNPPPSSSSSSSSSSPSLSAARPVKKEAKKVRAIYDFQAAEDNELSFRAGEIITLVDDSDENWWRGETHLGEGLFPASFVSRNLNKDPEPSKQEKKKSKNRTKTGTNVTDVARQIKVGGAEGVVNEQKVDLLLDMLKSADVTDTSNEESKTVKELESEVQSMRSMVESTVQQLTAKEEAMQTVSAQFNEALALYRKMLAEGPKLSDIAPPTMMSSYSHTTGQQQQQSGMTTHETHSVNNQVPPHPQTGMGTQLQSGMGTQLMSAMRTQPHIQNGIGIQPQYTAVQPQIAFQSLPPQSGMGTQLQSGMGTQPQLMTGVIQQNGMGTSPLQTGMGADHSQSTVYSSNPGHYATTHEHVTGEMSLQQPLTSLQYHHQQQPMTMVHQQPVTMVHQQPVTMVQQQQPSSYAPPYYQPAVSVTGHLPQPPPSHTSSSFLPPPSYHPPPTHTSQIVPQPLL